MPHQEFEPPELLRDSIRCFWYDCFDFGATESAIEVMPDGYAEIIFYFDSTCSMSVNGTIQSLTSPFIIGLLNQPALVISTNRMEIIGIRCYPWAVFDLLGIPPGAGSTPIFEHSIACLQPVLQQLIREGNIAGAAKQVEQYFINVQPARAAAIMLSKAGAAMTKAKGAIAVNKVAAAANATVRTLERNFKQSSGYTVKDVSGVMRFEQVRNRLWTDPGCNLAALAQELGYSDQSHLSKAFKRYSGTTPGAFARKSKKMQVAISSDFVAFLQA